MKSKNALIELQRQKNLTQFKQIVPLDGAYLLLEEGKKLNFCSHHFLGLSQHPDLKKQAIKFILEHGVGSATSHLPHTEFECQRLVEEKLAELMGCEAALIYDSSHQAHLAALATFTPSPSLIFMHRACHPSWIEACKNSRSALHLYETTAQLEQLLEETKSVSVFFRLILTESIFSQGGEVADLDLLISLADQHQALLYVDDSLALGIAGHQGMGLAAHRQEIDLIVGSFDKACAATGGFIACSSQARDYLTEHWNEASLSPGILGAISAALDLIPLMEGERKQLEQRGFWLKTKFQELGFLVKNTSTHLISLCFETKEEALQLVENLSEAHILATPEISLGVPLVTFALTTGHTLEDLHELIETVKTSLSMPRDKKESACFLAEAMQSLTDIP